MNNLNCPDCGRGMTILTSAEGHMTMMGPQGQAKIPSRRLAVAKCSCGEGWERDYGDEGPWRRITT
ncbi:hypothetical protein [Capillimicrobium parvum]|uniref:Uncharacterized protein n=1 Tax=Capillimicrobium parvum TaxID=2884022 RepID=A0A9E6XWW6_9ACTN|nr:hypothetical protein [Capillimicrobium parvum]UGS35633.1 hypothetical protein DSM104329_02028 [Capillimicrobium parvum]